MPREYHYWDATTHSWALYNARGLVIEDKPILLVPKQIVRHGFYYNTTQYFSSVVLKRKQEEQTTYDESGKELKPAKKQIKEMLLNAYGDIIDAASTETVTEPELLNVYHRRLNAAYFNRGMRDEQLDYWTYQR